MKIVAKISALLIATGMASTGFAYGPDADEVYVNNIVHAGTGCPIGTVATDISEDAKAFTLLFDEYFAEAGPGIAKKEARKFCQITLNLHVPQGWSYTFFKVDTAGYADLDRGTRGMQTSTYYFQGQRGRPKFRTTLRGPFSDDYEASDNLAVRGLVWSPCGVNRALNIKTDVRVSARGNKSAIMTVDSIDGEFMQTYGIKWKRCH